MTRKRNIVNDQSNVNYDVGDEIIYDNAYILVRGNITTHFFYISYSIFLVRPSQVSSCLGDC